MNDFTASNGVVVSYAGKTLYLESPGDSWPNPEPHALLLNADFEPALREFFRAEEDERLGRWRWPENPDYVVYLVGDDIVDVLRESSVSDEHRGPGRQAGITRDAARTWDNDYSQNFFRAARAFFDAHPEPKPWHDAEPEEVWILTIDGEEVLALIDEDREFHHRSQRRFRSVLDESITAGRRIWPEVTA